MRENIRRGSITISLMIFFLGTNGYGDIFDSSREARITCDNFNLPDLFDISSLLDFHIDIGGCSLGTTGLNSCQEKSIDFKTATDKLLGDGFKMFNTQSVCGESQPANTFGETTSLSGQSSQSSSTPDMGNWAQERYENSIEKENINPFSSTALLVNPSDGSILFSGGSNTEETRGIIVRDANMKGLFADGNDETMVSDSSAYQNIEKCKEEKASSSLECSLGENMKIYNKYSDEKSKLIDANSEKTIALIEVASMKDKTIAFPTQELTNKLPLRYRSTMVEGGDKKINTDALFRARMTAIASQRKSMLKLMAVKSALNATSKYPDISKKEAKKITAGVLP